MLLTQDQEMIRDAVRDFAQSELWPHAARWDREHHFPKEAHQGLAALGAYGICVPEELGGAGLDYLSLALVLEEIAAGDGGTSTVISVTNCPVNAILLRYGNPQQQRDWLAPHPSQPPPQTDRSQTRACSWLRSKHRRRVGR